LSSQGGRPGAADHESDSWRSHLWFGLATVALVVPFLIPGLPRRGLLVTYVGAGSVLMITPIVWGLIRSTRDAWQVRKARPRRGFWLGKE
jgi:hypothetical protein